MVEWERANVIVLVPGWCGVVVNTSAWIAGDRVQSLSVCPPNFPLLNSISEICNPACLGEVKRHWEGIFIVWILWKLCTVLSSKVEKAVSISIVNQHGRADIISVFLWNFASFKIILKTCNKKTKDNTISVWVKGFLDL